MQESPASVLEYVRGSSLRSGLQKLKQYRIPNDRRVRAAIALQAARGNTILMFFPHLPQTVSLQQCKQLEVTLFSSFPTTPEYCKVLNEVTVPPVHPIIGGTVTSFNTLQYSGVIGTEENDAQHGEDHAGWTLHKYRPEL